MNNGKIIAHRGASFDAPENTLSAIRLAWQQNADAVEIDVRLSQDGVIVLMHDESTLRTTGHDSKVAELSLSQLKRLDAGSWKSNQFQDEPIPALEEVLSELSAGKKLVIEIKDNRPEIIPILAKTIEDSKISSSQIMLISFDFPVIKLCKEQLPTTEVLPLYGKADHHKIEDFIRFCLENKLDGLDLHYASSIDENLTARLHSLGLLLYVWTVNDIQIARRLLAAGVDGITTDRPAWMREALL